MPEYVFPAAHLAGFFTAHVISTLPETKTGFTPILGTVNLDGRKELNRLVVESSVEAETQVARMTKINEGKWAQAVFLNDEFTRLGDTGKLFNSITITFIDFTHLPEPTKLVVPYSPPKFMSRLKIYRPKLVELPEPWRDSQSQTKLFKEFYKGVDNHDKGSRVWNKHTDDSV